MVSVVFDEQPVAPTVSATPRGITSWLIRNGIVRTEGQAALLLGIVSLACFVFAVIVFFKTVSEEPINPAREFVPVYTSVY